MVPELVWQIGGSILEILSGMLPVIVCAVVLMILSRFSSQACNPGRTWWRNPGLFTDACYFLVFRFIAPYMRVALLITGAVLLTGSTTREDISDYLEYGSGPLSDLPFWGQLPIYVVGSDFMLYWTHRIFHRRTLWRYHAIHHSAKDVDWTTAYRFHPVNLLFGSLLVGAIMLFVGISPTVALFMVPFDTATAYFVHANLNWTLGPLRYVVATPIFHRWHHTSPSEGGNANFAPLFPLWDILFGTFYMPEGKVPAHYGVDDPMFPQGFLSQLTYPFKHLVDFRVRRGETTFRPPTP
jgi:sterol desaturase/sphingolipid hydroxylase (fatty acid hydroxylase superfamily)